MKSNFSADPDDKKDEEKDSGSSSDWEGSSQDKDEFNGSKDDD